MGRKHCACDDKGKSTLQHELIKCLLNYPSGLFVLVVVFIGSK